MRALPLDPCQPPRWAKSGHGQTLLGYFLPSPLRQEDGEKCIVPLLDGDQLTARCFKRRREPVVAFFHGLGGDINSNYMHRSWKITKDLELSCVLVNHRGAGEGAALARFPYHSGRAEDLSAVIKFLRQKFPSSPIWAVGYSLSANALLLLMSGLRGDEKPDAALAVNAPIELAVASRSLSQGLNRIYDFRFSQACREDYRRRREEGRHVVDCDLRWGTKVEEIDKFYTAPAGGFASREDYYRLCSAKQGLHLIDRPTCILMSQDDPFIPFYTYESLQVSQQVDCHFEKTGGHLGYLTQNAKGKYSRWLDKALRTWLEQRLKAF